MVACEKGFSSLVVFGVLGMVLLMGLLVVNPLLVGAPGADGEIAGSVQLLREENQYMWIFNRGCRMIAPQRAGPLASINRPEAPPPSYTVHSPIFIDGDADFEIQAANEGWPGNGTQGNPYRIENFSIEASGTHLIRIMNTRVYFVVSNCYLRRFSSMGDGIWLINTWNANLTNNLIFETIIGINLSDCRSILATNNTIWAAAQTSVYLSVTTQQASFQWNAFLNVVKNPNDEGVLNHFGYNYYSDYAGYDYNGDGIGDSGFVLYDYSGANMTNYDAHPLMFLPDPPAWVDIPADQIMEFQHDFLFKLNATVGSRSYPLGSPPPYVPVAPIGQWTVNDTMHFHIGGNGTLYSVGSIPIGTYGLEIQVANLYGFKRSTEFSVRVIDSTPPAWVLTPTNQQIEYGTLLDYQIPVWDAAGIDHWTINDTSHFVLTPSFYESGSTARISSSGLLALGAYGLNLTTYDRHGNKLSSVFRISVVDTIPPMWVTAPVNLVLEYGDPLDYQFMAFDRGGIDQWTLNDTVHFSIDNTGRMTNQTLLASGVYQLAVSVYDTSGNFLSGSFCVTVGEAASPPPTPPPILGVVLVVIALSIVIVVGVGITIHRRRTQ